VDSYLEKGVRPVTEIRTDAFLEVICPTSASALVRPTTSHHKIVLMEDEVEVANGKLLLTVHPVEERTMVAWWWAAKSLDLRVF
jgi:hypothetical protein